MAQVVEAVDGEALDALVWRALGRGAGAVEAVLEANPGLAATAHALPAGTRVTLPEAAAAPQAQPLVQLWV